MAKSLEKYRLQYEKCKLEKKDLHVDPLIQLQLWVNKAIQEKCMEPNAMTLSTVEKNKPHSRIVLLKEITKKDLIFYTNYESAKGKQMQENPNVACVFLWHELERQVRVEGIVKKITRKKSEKYFYTRPIGSQISAMISPQSSVLKRYADLEKNTKYYENNPQEIVCPDHWGGYSIKPNYIEFWQGRPNRLHRRFAYSLSKNQWNIVELAP